MRKLTEEENEAFAELALTDPDAATRMSDAWRSMSDERRKQFMRFSERLAALPKGLDWTSEHLKYMLEDDTDFPYN